MRKTLAFLLLVLPVAAWAGEPKPVPAGSAHVCHAYYPVGALAARAEGVATVRFDIEADGSVKGVEIARSSGNADLDLATVKCVGTWRYKPTTRKGVAVEIPWQVAVAWKYPGADFKPMPAPITVVTTAPPAKAGETTVIRAHVCDNYPELAVRLGEEGTSLMSFLVRADGSVSDVTVARSSGSIDLDAAAVACVSTWRYKPATRNGVAVDVHWQASVMWKLHGSADPTAPFGPITAPPVAIGPAHDCVAYYPQALRDAGVAGVVRVSFTVAADGGLWDVKVVKSSGNASLDAAAVDCAGTWKFKPAMRGSVPSATAWAETIRFGTGWVP